MAREELIFADYLNVLKRYKLSIIAVICLGLFATVLLTGKEAVTYKSRARIKIQRQINVTQMFDEMLVSSGDPMENYLIELTGYAVISGAVARLAAPDKAGEQQIEALRAQITAERVAKTDLLDVYATGPTPMESRRRCEAVVESFIAQHDVALRKNAQEILETVQNSYETLSRNLRQREAELLEHLGPGAVTSVGESELAPLHRRLAEIQVELLKLRLTGNYTEEYPEIVRLKEESAQLEQMIEKKVLSELNREAQLSEYQRYKSIIENMNAFFAPRIEEAKIAASRKNEIVLVIDPPVDGVRVGSGRINKIIAGGLLSLMLGVVLAFVSDHLDTSLRNVAEIERIFKLPVLGIIPHFSLHDESRPYERRRFVLRMRGFVPSAGVAVLRRAFSSFFSRSARRGSNISSHAARLIVPLSPRSPAAEAYRTLRINLLLRLGGESNAVVFTSASPEEGKSTSLANLAVACAQAGRRVLLVDCNMRRPQMHRIFGLVRERGLSDILLGDVKWRDALKDYRDVALGEGTAQIAAAAGMENLQFITCGGRTLHPSEWLSQPVLPELAAEWKSNYELVFFDSPPVLPVPDSVILSMIIRRTVLIYQVGVTPRESVRRAVSAIQNTGASILGIVLNDLRPTTVDESDFYQYRHYYGRQE